MNAERAIIITGPTASGKTRLAVELAKALDGEIVGADSRQVFRGMDIGTGKDLEEYGSVPYHLIDVAEPQQPFHMFEYLRLAKEALHDIAARGKLPVVCGGTPLYVKALLDGYGYTGGEPDEELRGKLRDTPLPELVEILSREAPPELFRRTDLTQPRRVIRAIELARHAQLAPQTPFVKDPLLLAPYYHRDVIRERIRIRLDQRLARGLVEEVRALHDGGIPWERLDWFGLEYRFIARHLQGALTWQEMHDQLLQHICQFAKRQDGWFRKLERDGHCIHWLPDGTLPQALALARLWLKGGTLPPPEIRLDDIRYGKPFQQGDRT